MNQEEAIVKIERIFKERGTKALEAATREILNEKIESEEARRALEYFMTKYWHDTARPALMSLVCEAVGGSPNVTTPIAVPMILISGAIDIHDDIIDQSKSKYNRPTVYGKFGKEIALLAGDALLFKGLTLLNRSTQDGFPSEKMPEIIDILQKMFFDLGDAEAMELRFRGQTTISAHDYVHVVRKKAADVEAHTKIGAILGDGTEDEIRALAKYGRILGMLIILRDDWIDMIDPAESRHRIQNESFPLPILYALERENAKCRLKAIIQKGRLTNKDIKAIMELAKEMQGMKKFDKLARNLMKKALLQLTNIKRNREYLELLVRVVKPLD